MSGAPIQFQQQLKFQIQKSPVIADEASLYWRNGWAGIPLGWHSSGTLDLVSGAPIQLQQQLKFQIQKSPVISDEASLCWRSGWGWHSTELASQRDSRPRVRCTNTIPITVLNFRYKKAPSFLTRLHCIGGADGTRTRDPRRDRPVF